MDHAAGRGWLLDLGGLLGESSIEGIEGTAIVEPAVSLVEFKMAMSGFSPSRTSRRQSRMSAVEATAEVCR
jgi:hypothetical protein